MAKNDIHKSSTKEDKKLMPARKTNGSAKHNASSKKQPPMSKKLQNGKEDDKNVKETMLWRKTLLQGKEENKSIQESLKALVPYTIGSASKGTTKLFWPSAVFFNAAYANGILFHDNYNDNKTHDPRPYFRATPGYAETANWGGLRAFPFLSQMETKLWAHKHAAHTAVARRFPVEVGRLLGTITLEIEEISPRQQNGTKGTFEANFTAPTIPPFLRAQKKQAAKMFFGDAKSRNISVKKISRPQAFNEADTERLSTPNKTFYSGGRMARALEIHEQWRVIQDCQPYPETWNPFDGSFSFGENDDNHVTLRGIQTWLQQGATNGTLVDLHRNETRELYGGRISLPIDAASVLQALASMANVEESIYGVPLMTAYPRIERSTGGENKESTVWKIQLGVYMHRLLPEIFCCQELHIIMSAMDPGSYNVTEPLRLPPEGSRVFESAPYPKVEFQVAENNKNSIKNFNEDEMEGRSRDEMVVSAFSVKGLLKLLENKGCDVSAWPKIEQALEGKFKLDLFLHQQHAICWMIQMENLEGAYGINSLLWEQRTFPDGGHYYYSPALGQVRLGAPPPLMKGGLICDEQGLGKTVEVLGLIMATLDELKIEARHRIESKKRRTYKGSYSSAASDDEEHISHTTLIIVPPALLGQWLHEIEKATSSLTVSLMMSQTGELRRCLPVPCVNKKDEDKSADTKDDNWDIVKSSDILLTTYDALERPRACKTLADVEWGRIVLDEMQEIRSPTTVIAKNCESLKCARRWMLSGTPIFQGIGDLRGELNFLRLEPFAAGLDDGFFDFAVQRPWEAKEPRAVATLQILCLVALRRSKDMTVAATGDDLLDLKPLTVEFIPVPQTVSERAIYCWMEYIVASELELTSYKRTKDSDSVAPKAAQRDAKSRTLCLRLLRELCISPILINGGLGVVSQLHEVNKLMINHNRRELEARAVHNPNEDSDGDDALGGGRRKRLDSATVMSCDEALRFLSQHEEQARTAWDDMVTEVAVGGSRGATNRDRAFGNAADRLKEAKDAVARAETSLALAKTKRAKNRWHLALEKVSTGQYSDGRTHKFSGLWKWRHLIFGMMQGTAELRNPNKAMAQLLSRGWRPRSNFISRLFEIRPDFHWCHPNSILLRNIPSEVTQNELVDAMKSAALRVPMEEIEKERCELRLSKLMKSEHKDRADHVKKIKEQKEKLDHVMERIEKLREDDDQVMTPCVVKVRERKHLKGFWKAYVLFGVQRDLSSAMSAFGRTSGVPIVSLKPVPHIRQRLDVAKEKVALAEAEFQVHPSEASKDRLVQARKELARVSSGLRCVSTPYKDSLLDVTEEIGTDQAMVIASKAHGILRSMSPRNASTLIASLSVAVAQLTAEIYRQETIVAKGKKDTKKFQRAMITPVSTKTAETSAYGVLMALLDGNVDSTLCPICLGSLGEDDDVGTTASRQAERKRKHRQVGITMVSCGHFFCTTCINDHISEMVSSNRPVSCPSCRKSFSSHDCILVDRHLKSEQEALRKEREAAIELVREAGKLLVESDGQLDSEMWRALYVSFDLPVGIPNRGDPTFTAIPRDALTHLQGATGMKVNCGRNERPPPGRPKGTGRSSKIRKLLADLPANERCVVFSSSKECLFHLKAVFTEDNIGFQAIYTGQTTSELRSAVTKWEGPGEQASDPPPFPCLLVQAGAAAAGLTLTAACKMFVLEPFLRQEEEHQAYARCHRYSQKHKVTVKVYYTPVSVESRLLHWRKNGKASFMKRGADEATDVDLCQLRKGTKIIVHNVDDDSDDEDEGSISEASDSKGETDDNTTNESLDIAQVNFLLGLLD